MLAVSENLSSAAAESRLAGHLSRWREIPLYAPAFASGDFFNLPVITKKALQHNFPANFLPPGQVLEDLVERKAVILEYSSGTSDDRTPVLMPPGWWEVQEDRILKLNPLARHVLAEYPEARRVTIVPPVCNGLVCFSNFMARAERTVGSTLYVNLARIPFLNTEAELARMAAETAEWAPQFLDLDPVQGAWFARYCERQGLRFPSLQFLFCSYEFVSVVHRRILERVFGVPVLNLYGSTETGHLLMENQRGQMVPCPEAVFYEMAGVDEQGVGDLVVSTLTNEAMPLLRYRIGDLVSQESGAGGEHYVIHGRARDALQRDDGRRVTTWQVDQCFAGVAGLMHYQLRQTATGHLTLQWIAEATPPAPSALNEIRSRLENLLQPPAPIQVEQVTMLPPTPSGKFRLTCRV